MAQDRLQTQRFELKYHVNEEIALGIRDFLRAYLEPDEYGAALPNYSYPVHSLYVDSDDLKLYQATINGDKNRFKLRVRYYDDDPSAPIFLEIKRRLDNTISKKRAAIHRSALEEVLSGRLPDPGTLLSSEPAQVDALQNFCERVGYLQARPKTHVRYYREAWWTPEDNSVRVTMDRDVLSEPRPSSELTTHMQDPVTVFGNAVILELKFTNRFPKWFRDLVQAFGLRSWGAAKYVDGIIRLGEHRVNQAFVMSDLSESGNRPSH